MAKIILIEDALELIKDNDHIVTGMAASEGREFLKNIQKIEGKVKKRQNNK